MNVWDVYLKLSSIHCKIASIMESKAFAAVMYLILLFTVILPLFLRPMVSASGQIFVASATLREPEYFEIIC